MSLDAYAQELSASLAKAGLVPGSAPLIPDNFTPSTQLTIKFGEKAVELGNLFRASECKGAPSVDFTPEVSFPIYVGFIWGKTEIIMKLANVTKDIRSYSRRAWMAPNDTCYS